MVHEPIIYRPLDYGAHRVAPGNDDGQQYFIVALVLALIALVLLLVIGIAIRHAHGKVDGKPALAAAMAIPVAAVAKPVY